MGGLNILPEEGMVFAWGGRKNSAVQLNNKEDNLTRTKPYEICVHSKLSTHIWTN